MPPANPDWVSRNVRLVIGNRARKRLRISLWTVLTDLRRQFGFTPGEIRLTRARGEPLRLTTGDRVFLSPSQTRAVGGFRRHGQRVRVEFRITLRLYIYDYSYLADNASYRPAGAIDATGPPQLVLRGSGFGILVRVEQCARGDPMSELRVASERLRSYEPFKLWLEEFLRRLAAGEQDGMAVLPCEPNSPKAVRWFVQVLRQDSRGLGGTDAAGGVVKHTVAVSAFKVERNEGLETPFPERRFEVRG